MADAGRGLPICCVLTQNRRPCGQLVASAGWQTCALDTWCHDDGGAPGAIAHTWRNAGPAIPSDGTRCEGCGEAFGVLSRPCCVARTHVAGVGRSTGGSGSASRGQGAARSGSLVETCGMRGCSTGGPMDPVAARLGRACLDGRRMTGMPPRRKPQIGTVAILAPRSWARACPRRPPSREVLWLAVGRQETRRSVRMSWNPASPATGRSPRKDMYECEYASAHAEGCT